jgi:Stage II sporulation protein E (SpoIIE)
LRRHILCCLLAVAALVAAAAAAESVPAGPAVRYHFGDNPAWAGVDFDDNAWNVALNSEFPSPRFESDGYFWVRLKLPVPAGVNQPFAIQSSAPDSVIDVLEIFVNGARVGQYGEFPPHAAPRIQPEILVFDLPPGTVTPGTVATVALRGWTLPPNRDHGPLGNAESTIVASFKIDSSALLHAVAAQAQDRMAIRYAPQLAVGFVFIVFGIGVLALGLWSRSRELLVCATWLVVAPLFLSAFPVSELAAGADMRLLNTIFQVVNGIGMALSLELLWTVQGFRRRVFLHLARLCWVATALGGVLTSNLTTAGSLARIAILMSNGALFAFNIIVAAASLVALAGRGRNRPVAAAMILINIGYFLRIVGVPLSFGFLPLDFFQASFYLSVFTVAAVLVRQTWKRWKEGDDLRIEFAAARELQQQLVPSDLPDVGNLRMSAAYLPAKDVGGDFYQVIELPDCATLLLLGDVSGKGLKAAMTGLLTIGAAHALAAETSDPAVLLQRLNREICRHHREGFITCICARISTDGAVTIANAGHLSPYRNSEEIQVESSLPLGLIPSVEYPETTLQLSPGDTFTLLSDGVVEAQSASGELFGFDRTRAIIHQPPAAIAEAARAYGQSDDITVLTLAFVPAEVPA